MSRSFKPWQDETCPGPCGRRTWTPKRVTAYGGRGVTIDGVWRIVCDDDREWWEQTGRVAATTAIGVGQASLFDLDDDDVLDDDTGEEDDGG